MNRYSISLWNYLKKFKSDSGEELSIFFSELYVRKDSLCHNINPKQEVLPFGYQTVQHFDKFGQRWEME